MADSIDQLASASLHQVVLSEFRNDYINHSKGAGMIFLREIHQFNPENDRRMEIKGVPKIDAVFSSILDKAVSRGSKSYSAKGVFDGVSYDCSFDYIDGSSTRWTLFCPSEADDSEIAQIGNLLDSLFDLTERVK